MQRRFIQPLLFLILAFAAIALFWLVLGFLHPVGGGQATVAAELGRLNPSFFVAAACLYLASILVWVFSWGYLLKKRVTLSYRFPLLVGFSALYGSLTPGQLGADALRAHRMKKYANVPYKETLSAAFVSKGTKFLVLGFVGLAVLSYFLNTKLDPLFFFGFAGGLFMVFLAAALFLFPLNASAAGTFAHFFARLTKKIPFLSGSSTFFSNYRNALGKLPNETFFILLIFGALSLALEFFALQFTFFSLAIELSFHSLLLLAVLIFVLERTPFLPRGLGIVELAGYYFLAFPQLIAGITLTAAQIGAALTAFTVVRVVIPATVSLLVSLFLPRQQK